MLFSNSHNELLDTIIKFPTDVDKQKELCRGFANRGFPQCVGVIDGSHIPIIAPKEQPEDYYNRKHFFSINVQAICDSRRRLSNYIVNIVVLY